MVEAIQLYVCDSVFQECFLVAQRHAVSTQKSYLRIIDHFGTFYLEQFIRDPSRRIIPAHMFKRMSRSRFETIAIGFILWKSKVRYSESYIRTHQSVIQFYCAILGKDKFPEGGNL